MSQTAYRNLLARLLPRGKAWEKIKEFGLWAGIAEELCRVDERVKDFLRELDPGTSEELIEDWERVLGLPDECTPDNQTLAERQLQARQKLGTLNGLNASFYEETGEKLGFEDVIVRDYVDFRVGEARVGDALTNGFEKYFRVGDRVGDRLYASGWTYWFEVNIEATDLNTFRVGENTVGQPLVSFENPLFECTIQKLKPAHTGAYFTFR